MKNFLKLNPITKKKLNRFKDLKRGYYSFIIFSFILFATFSAEFWCNSKALLVKYQDNYYFPTFSGVIPGTKFGLDYQFETNYRELKEKWMQENSANWVLLPIIPFNPYENDFPENSYPPLPPDFNRGHYLGTDTSGRDIAARLVYGFRIAIIFSMGLLIINYFNGITIGCLMGYWGGRFDLFMQRLIEIWSNIPFLYVIIIIASLVTPSLIMLMAIMAIFDWVGMTWYMRTLTFREKAKEYVTAAKALGAGHFRVIFSHIIPNSMSVIVTFIPFSITGGMTALTSLDYLGFGLLPPTPSWGELLSQGTNRLDAPWIGASVVLSMVIVLTMITFIGEGIREAFDPKKYTTYR